MLDLPTLATFVVVVLGLFIVPGSAVQPARGSAIPQLAILGLVFVAMSAAYTTLIAVGAGAFGRWLARHRGVGRWQGKLVGGIYLGLGVKLALQQR